MMFHRSAAADLSWRYVCAGGAEYPRRLSTPPLGPGMAKSDPVRETDLYAPVKAFLEAQGYAVKGEVEGCDLVAVRSDETPVVVELKRSFTLGLVFQGIARQGVTENVYLAVPPFSTRTTRRRDALALCRRLGLGLLIVRLETRASRPGGTGPGRILAREVERDGSGGCSGSSSAGWEIRTRGGTTRRKLMTAYRQDALRCASYLERKGPTRASGVALDTGVASARVMMYVDHYGWFRTNTRNAPRDLRADAEGSSRARGVHERIVGSLACAQVGPVAG